MHRADAIYGAVAQQRLLDNPDRDGWCKESKAGTGEDAEPQPLICRYYQQEN